MALQCLHFQWRIQTLLSPWIVVKVTLNWQYRLLVSLFLLDNMTSNSLLSNPHSPSITRKKKKKTKTKNSYYQHHYSTPFQEYQHQPTGRDIYSTLHPTAAEYIFCSRVYGRYMKIDNILGYKAILKKILKTEIIQNVFYNQNGIK